MTTEVPATPLVRALASRLGVNLAQLTGTGVGGRITSGDVRAAAPRRPAAGTAAAVPVSSSPHVTRNPRLDEFRKRRNAAEMTAQVKRAGAAPTLFSAGDLPAFTASGIEPQRLMELPWPARHPAATNGDRSQVLAMFERFTPIDESTYADAVWAHGGHPGNLDYSERFRQWEMT